MEKQRKYDRDQVIDFVFFLLLLAVVSVVTLELFHRQTLGSPENGYHSDMKAYILKMQGLDSGYSFPYPVFFKVAAFFWLFSSPEFAVALATMALNSLAIVIVKLALNRMILTGCEECGGFLRKKWAVGILLSLFSVSLFFISMLYPPKGIYLPGIKFKYLGVFTANPFHNATYMAARPFAILAFLWYVKLLDVYEKGMRTKKNPEGVTPLDYVLFSLFLLTATMTKPSFTIILAAAAGLIMIFRLLRNRLQNFLPAVQLGVCFLPTFIDLIYQYSGVFVPVEGDEGGIGFCFGEVWKYYSGNIPLSVGLAIGFPLLVLMLNYGEIKRNTMYRFSWQLYLIAFLTAFFLYEKGFRKPDFNFSWGYMYGIFFCHFSSLAVLLQKTLQECEPYSHRKADGKGPLWKRLALLVQWMAYLCHVVCGLAYFGVIMSGASYY